MPSVASQQNQAMGLGSRGDGDVGKTGMSAGCQRTVGQGASFPTDSAVERKDSI